MLQSDAKEQKVIKAKEQVDKAISSLKGILLGIDIDNSINETEMNELRNWVSVQNEMGNRNPFREFTSIIKHALSNKIPAKEAVADLTWLCDKYEAEKHFFNTVRTDLQTLRGICQGIMADGVISELEIIDLNEWLLKNEHLRTYYPYDEVRSIVLSITTDGKIEEEEKLILKAYFAQFVHLNNPGIEEQIKTDTSAIEITSHCVSNPDIDFAGKSFCITGIMNKVNREDLKNEITKQGGIVTEAIDRKTDYLIIGDNGNPTWAYACYGRKVEDALILKEKGHTITLIHESDLEDIFENYI